MAKQTCIRFFSACVPVIAGVVNNPFLLFICLRKCFIGLTGSFMYEFTKQSTKAIKNLKYFCTAIVLSVKLIFVIYQQYGL